MSDEKKPPQEVVDTAQIVIAVNQDGAVQMTATCWGMPDSTFVTFSDDRLLKVQIPFILNELRLQLKLGRRLTTEESAALKDKVRQSSGLVKTL